MFIKKNLVILLCMLLSTCMFAQNKGIITGKVVSRGDKQPISSAKVVLYLADKEISSQNVTGSGQFSFTKLADGHYELVISASNYYDTREHVSVDKGNKRDLFTISLSPIKNVEEDINMSDDLTEFDSDDSGYQDSPNVLYNQNDVFNNIAGFNFSVVRFRPRGYANESQDVYLAGIPMNDAFTNYAPYSMWSGLNEVTRSKTAVVGSEISQYGLGGYNGLINIDPTANAVRKGLRGSVLTNSALYRLRLMLTYASGQMDNGLSYAISASARLGGNDWVKGVFYKSFAYYASISKAFNDANKLSFTLMATPGERGTQNASTQEVYDLYGSNFYNSNWGYQNGKVRNAKVRITHEPIAILKYDYTPSDNFSSSLTFLYRFGKNGYTALDWYDAADPRPDYYRNLPSYFYSVNGDLNKNDIYKASWLEDAWRTHNPVVTHIDWDRMYNVNRSNIVDGQLRSKYVVEERRTDQQDLNLGLNATWRPSNYTKISGGVVAKINRTENYKILNDLLGGQYYLDVDQFAERDFGNPIMSQNDLDYFLQNGYAKKVRIGDKYGYDYYSQLRRINSWFAIQYTYAGLDANFGISLGYDAFWRDGLMRKGLFPGLKDGKEITFNDKVITNYDSKGQPITSYGYSKTADFFTYSAKLNLAYNFQGGHRTALNLGYFNDAPTFKQIFLSPRTRNSMVDNIKTIKIATADLTYQYVNNGYNLRLTGFVTSIKDQTDVMSFYDDSQRSFTNLALTGINQLNYGVELGFKVPFFIQNLYLQGVVSWGRYMYTSTPRMTQTMDNNSQVIIENQPVVYWQSHPNVNGKTIQHFVPGTPQFASSLGFSWSKNYWFVDLDANYFADNYLSMNPLYRTDFATMGPDSQVTPQEVEYMAGQEKFKPAFLLNLSVGKSWYINYKYQLGFSLNVKNLLNNTNVKTGGFEQSRIIENTKAKERYYKFDPKYFYMPGVNYMLNIYFRF